MKVTMNQEFDEIAYSDWQKGIDDAARKDSPSLRPDFIPTDALLRAEKKQIQLSKETENAKRQAMFDALTEVHSKLWLNEVGSGWDPKTTAVVFIDFDRFKSINDEHGHIVGDTVLRKIADRLQKHKEEADAVVRYGGEEFLLLLHDFKPKGLSGLKNRLQRVVFGDPVSFGNKSISVGASCGVAFGEELSRVNPHMSIMDLVNFADKAMYEEKNLRRGKSTFSGAGLRKYEAALGDHPIPEPTPIDSGAPPPPFVR